MNRRYTPSSFTPLGEQNAMDERLLYQMPFCPLSRKIAFGLMEKGVPVTPVMERTWNPSPQALALSVAGELPILQDSDVVCGNDFVACEYIEAVYSSPPMMGKHPGEGVAVRTIMSWFDRIFYHDAYLTLFFERALKRAIQQQGPDTSVLKKGRQQLRVLLHTVNSWAQQDRFLAGSSFSWADVTAAAHLSCLDYLGEIPWHDYASLYEWYAKIKSRPTFRGFLMQKFPGLSPAPHYHVLDF